MQRYTTATCLALASLSVLAGCSRSFNGPLGLSHAERAEIAEYQEAKRVTAKGASTFTQTDTGRSPIAPPIPTPQPTRALTISDDAAVFAGPAATPPSATEPVSTAAEPMPRVAPAANNQNAPQAIFAPINNTPQDARETTSGVGGDPRRTGLHRFGELDDLQMPTVSPLDHQGNLRRVTFTHEGADFDVEIDPTGQWLVYASTRHRQTSDLYFQRVDGTAVTQLTTDPANDVMPSISPDGSQVAFASDRAGTWDIYLMDTDGGPAVKLTEDGAQNLHPSFSPDGRQLVYSSRGTQSGVWELVVIDITRPAHRKVIGHGLFPTWSPNGDKIAYQRARERGSRWFSVWTVTITDRGEAVHPTEIAASSNAAIITPEWSPDGRNIVFCTVLDPTADSPAGSKADIWIANADGSGRARLTHGNYGNLYPTWAADGSIYFVSNRGVDAIENVYALKPDKAVHLARQRERKPANKTMEATVPVPVAP
ncbi:MAG: DPP IV N-terminal domain-containing protein [Planctomycetota bacterium]